MDTCCGNLSQYQVLQIILISMWLFKISTFFKNEFTIANKFFSILSSVLEITWPESAAWIMCGFLIYLLYGIANSSVAISGKNTGIYKNPDKTRKGPFQNSDTDKLANDCMVLSKRPKPSTTEKETNAIIKNFKLQSEPTKTTNEDILIKEGPSDYTPTHEK